MCGSWWMPNEQGAGYYRFAMPAQSWSALRKHGYSNLSEAGRRVAVDVTLLMKAVYEGGRGSDGFALTVPPYRGEGLSASDASRLAALSNATLDVAYMRVSAPPPLAWQTRQQEKTGAAARARRADLT